jgi:hypothetical protein
LDLKVRTFEPSDKIVGVREQRTEIASLDVLLFGLGPETIAEVTFFPAYLESPFDRDRHTEGLAQDGVELLVAACCRTARCDGIL